MSLNQETRISELEGQLAQTEKDAEELSAENAKLFNDLECLLELLRSSFMEHGDCKSGKRYGGIPKACTACMAQLELKEVVGKWKGRKIRLA